LEEFTIDESIFLTLVTKCELEKGQYIYLEDEKIKFDTYTIPPHAEVIANVLTQIYVQNNNPQLFMGGTGGGRTPFINFLADYVQMLRSKHRTSNQMLTGLSELIFFQILNKF
jgi:hypothetical protein